MQPQSSDVDTAVPDSLECAELLRNGSKTFHAAARVLPAGLRQAATGLYAFCRLADDAVDLGTDGLAALERLRGRLDRIYAGRPEAIAADRAFADVVTRFAIPQVLPQALLDGFEWDVRQRQYQTLSELQDYAARVAGTVGAMMAMLMHVREPQVLSRACELGVAMQLTNIARDVGEDAAMGRLYLPRSWLAEAGIDADDWLADPGHTAALGEVIERLLTHADRLYAGAGAAIAKLPIGARPGMHAARLLYSEIGQELRRRGRNSVTHRAVVSWRRKGPLLAVAILAAIRRDSLTESSTLAETQFLVDAAAAAPVVAPPELSRGNSALDERVAWLVDLFERLERRDREAMMSGRVGGLAGAAVGEST